MFQHSDIIIASKMSEMNVRNTMTPDREHKQNNDLHFDASAIHNNIPNIADTALVNEVSIQAF